MRTDCELEAMANRMLVIRFRNVEVTVVTFCLLQNANAKSWVVFVNDRQLFEMTTM